MKIKLNTEVGPFDGEPTVGQLIAALSGMPGSAYVHMETWDSQREGSGWRLRLNWEEDR